MSGMLQAIGRALVSTWALAGEMAPYLLLGFLVAGLLHAFLKPSFVARHLGRRGFGQVFKATLIGVPMPLCSCSVVPVTAWLRRHGARKGAAAAFIASTPETGVDSIAATWGLMGPLFAVARVAAAFVTGIAAGTLVEASDREPDADPAAADNGTDATNGGPRWRSALRHAFIVLPRDIGRALLVGLLIAGAVSAFVPPGYVSAEWAGSPFAFLAVTLVAVPIYVCSTGSVPVAVAMLHSGLSPGAALIFLIAGPATNAATIAALWKMLGRRATAIYLGAIVGTAWLAGFALDTLPWAVRISETACEHAAAARGSPIAAALLLALLAPSLRPKRREPAPDPAASDGAPDLRLRVTGMTCESCAGRVRRSLEGVPGVRAAVVSVDGESADLRGEGIDADEAVRRVRALGYGAGPRD
jgi:uncharacterized membrane protein YraQ (UPF0718 family)/copper chaperone CopZ